MDIAEIRQDLADLLSTVGDFRVYPTVLGSFNTPAAVIYPNPSGFPYHATYEGADTPTFIVQLIVAATNESAVQTQLDAWLGTGTPNSAVDAIETNGAYRVVDLQNYGGIIDAQQVVRYYSAQLLVEVLT